MSVKGLWYPPHFKNGRLTRKGFFVLGNAMASFRWNAGVLRRLRHICVVAGCDFYRMGLQEGMRNYSGIADLVFTEDPELIAAKGSLPFSVVSNTWFPAKAIQQSFMTNPIVPAADRDFDVGIFKRAGWEKNWDFLLDGPDPFVGLKVFVHCPWHERWYNDQEKAIFYKVVRVCRDRKYFVDTRVHPNNKMASLYDNCRSVLLFSTTESDSRMMVEAFFRECCLHLWSGTRHLMPKQIAEAAVSFDTFDKIDFSKPPVVEVVGRERRSGFWGVEASSDALLGFFMKFEVYPKSIENSLSLYNRDFAQHDAHTCFYHVCREGEEIKMMQSIVEAVHHED